MNFLFNYLSTVEETLFLFINLHFRKGLKILETGIAPFLCILQLYIEQRVCMLPFLLMPLHILLGWGMPKVAVNFYHRYTHVVLHAEFLPEGAAWFHLVIPRHMMEPEKVFLRTGLDVIIQTAIWFWILTDSICAPWMNGRNLYPEHQPCDSRPDTIPKDNLRWNHLAPDRSGGRTWRCGANPKASYSWRKLRAKSSSSSLQV